MPAPLHDVCCDALPAAALSMLAGLRTRDDVRVLLREGRAWVFWPAGEDEVLRRVLPVPGAALFARRGEHWYAPGSSLPAFDVPDADDAQALLTLLTPAPLLPEISPPAALEAPTLTLVRDDRPRATTALCCRPAELARWAEWATTRQLTSLEAARCGDRVLLRGERLPLLPGGERYWGTTVLVPLGFRPQPDLAEALLRAALGLDDAELALLGADGVEVVPRDSLRPLHRAEARRVAEKEGGTWTA
jgi:hypothetical protein